MTFTRSRLVIIGAITLLVGLLVMFPARVAYHWVAPPGVALSGIDGSIWRGQAREGEVGGIYLRNVNWRMQPLALFRAKLGYAVEADAASGFVAGIATIGMGGSAALQDLTASLSLRDFQGLVRMPGLDGMVNLQFERLEFENGIPVAADGNLQVANLRAPLIYRAPIGGFRAEFFTQESGVMASVEDTDAVVDIAGSLSLSTDRTYQFLAQVAPKSDTPADLKEQMRFLGTANERGQYELRLEGQL